MLKFGMVVVGCFWAGMALDSEGAKAGLIGHAQGEMAGEVTTDSVILQSRLTTGDVLVDGDVPGAPGVACFELGLSEDFSDSRRLEWIGAVPEQDYIVKSKVTQLRPGRRYYYRLVFGEDRANVRTGPTCTFRTLAGQEVAEEVSFVVVTSLCYDLFYYGYSGRGKDKRGYRQAYEGDDKHLGFPGLESILKLSPDFFVGTGDNVYYDCISDYRKTPARTLSELRTKWHRLFSQPRFVRLLSCVPTYWEKDDHDHRYNDCDNSGDKEPSSELGIRVFKEQVPIVDPNDPSAVTYRTHRINKLLQIWLVEGRDYRSPNRMPDGPNKTIWGQRQKAWLKQTLLASDATFKILISPTPMVGPDSAKKRDNHTNIDGFQHEGNEFFAWLKEKDFLEKHLYVLCGDRHWQYHSVHPSGFEEFSCGALNDCTSRLGPKPGSPGSTDPEGRIQRLYDQKKPSGGFLRVVVRPGDGTHQSSAEFCFHDKTGVLLYGSRKIAR